MLWQARPKAPSAFLKQFPEFSPLVVQLLYNRGLKTQKQIDEFFNPDYQTDLHSPFLFREMKKAVKRVFEAVERKEKIIVYGDYDADGVCAAAIVFLTLKELGADRLGVYIPDREKENHGLNKKAVERLAQAGAKLVITVDCASSDLEEADLAKSLGIDLIITDHHQTREKLPRTIALINPLEKKEKYPFKDLAGAGIAYKLAEAVLSDKKAKQRIDSPESFKKWLLDLASLGTVADVSPIIGENRTLVKYGLGVLAQTKWLGLQELMKIAQVNPELSRPSLSGEAPLTNLNTHTLSYVLGPRLNAASRMDHANVAFELLITQDRKNAKKLAKQLNQNNSARQNLTDKIVQEVERRLEKLFRQGREPKFIFEGSPDWPVGLVGLVAGKVAEKYSRPAVVYQKKNNKISASCRTIPQFNLIEALNQAAEYFDDFGGRPGTAGFRMNSKNLEKVKEILNQVAGKKLKDQDLTSSLDIDAELSLEDVTWQNYDKIQSFAPFGPNNPEPRFISRGLKLINLRIVGNNGKHLKLELRMNNQEGKLAKNFKAIGFGLADWKNKLKEGDLIDLVFELIADEWNGWRDLQMKVVDIKKVKGA